MLLLALCSWELAGAPWPVSLLGAFYRAGSFAVGGDAALSPLLLAEGVPRAGSAAALLRARATAQILPGPAAGMAAHLGGASAGPAGTFAGRGLRVGKRRLGRAAARHPCLLGRARLALGGGAPHSGGAAVPPRAQWEAESRAPASAKKSYKSDACRTLRH